MTRFRIACLGVTFAALLSMFIGAAVATADQSLVDDVGYGCDARGIKTAGTDANNDGDFDDAGDTKPVCFGDVNNYSGTAGDTQTLDEQWDKSAPVAISINTDFWSWVAASLPLALAIGLPLLLVAMVYRRLAG